MADKPNIILISLDTVRADHLSCYGYPQPTTPNIDKLAEDGVLFEQAFSTAVWTPPAHASMLTGLYPSEHGVVDQNRLDPSISTIAEILLANSYHTAGFVNNSQVGELVGLDKGHETFVEVWRGVESRNLLERAVRYAGRKALDVIGARDHGAHLTNRLAIKWLEKIRAADKPFYLFLHYIDAHNPLKAPLPYRTRFIEKESTKRIDKEKVSLMADNPLRFYTRNIHLTEEENNYLIGLYDGEIAYLDQRVGEIVAYLKRNNLYDNTLLILTADHGEHFGEHGHFSHVGSLYQPIIHVPLILSCPHDVAGGERRKKKVRLIDILPTILDAIGLSTERCSNYGASLIGGGTNPHDYIVSEWEGRVPYFVLNDLNCGENDPVAQKFKIKKWAIQNEEYKYIRADGGEEELYQLGVDPAESANLIAREKTIGLLLSSQLEEWRDSITTEFRRPSEYQTDEAIRKNLKDLGYL